ncbi:MAG: UTP--glucose-1-phosphate uridylyltransferase [Myxococcota bacterium]|jgi:UTP--glucose-1-phosphate uridylyltransferase|nr:UTP--glucose-1-phosphate uridylyltransferase [Myxococcota bacterium]
MQDSQIQAIVSKMTAEGLHPRVIDMFCEQYRAFRAGETGKLAWSEVEQPRPDDIVPWAQNDTEDARAAGKALLSELVVIQLNGGLGTTMKLDRAKSLIEVREEHSFLDITALQVLELRKRHQVDIPLLAMNSFRTRADTLAALASHPELPVEGLPLDFVQNKVPRIERSSGLPVDFGGGDDEWAPPGHGDIYVSLWATELLEKLIAKGYRWAFVSNVDNLGATVDPAILGYLERAGVDFAMEVTDKTLADIKGGTLIRHRGRLCLLEGAQVEDEHLKDFQDISTFSVFNTNNLWWRMESMLEALKSGALSLQLIVNPKTVRGVNVVQLETAMGAAVGCFEHARGLRVPRSRFAPVKSTADLLALRSDVYVLNDDFQIVPNPQRTMGPPVIVLDDLYKGIDAFELRFPHPMNLLKCTRLTIKGDVRFGKNVRISGDVIIENLRDEPVFIPDHQHYAEQVVRFG